MRISWRELSQKAIHGARTWALDQTKSCFRCRECHRSIKFGDTVCQHCGASEPARISRQASMTVLAVGGATVALGMWLFT